MNLRYLLYPWVQNYIPNINILGLSLNSKLIKNNELFFAVSGYSCYGKDFIIEAIKNGSSCIILENNNIINHGKVIYIKQNIPIIFFYNLKKYISNISGNFYNNPSKNINVIGITGTNGKTTTTYLISKWMELLGDKSSIISTLGNGNINNLRKTLNTTDSALDMQKEIFNFKSKGIKNIISEISSHSISQYRVKSINFKYSIFTNISHDHLDYYKNFNNYKLSKISFFKNHKILNNIINIDDKTGKYLFKILNNKSYISLKRHNIKYSKNWIYAEKIIVKKTYTNIFFNSNFGKNNIIVNFIGLFNINNLLLSMITMLNLGYPLLDLINTSKYLNLPIGRMQFFNYKDKIIIVDYAHTPDAIKKILITINTLYKTNIWVIIGCGGDRDIKKRSIIGSIIEKYSNKIILTNDNPRNENPKSIIKNILSGINNNKNVLIILNRKNAIIYAINNSCYNDIIIIFGKGHENYQIYKNYTKSYSDIKTINKLIKSD